MAQVQVVSETTLNDLQEKIRHRTARVGIVGLGYVGLPLAMAFAKVHETIGFDISTRRIRELRDGYDRTGEVDADELRQGTIHFTDCVDELRKADFHIVAVPTPVTDAMIGRLLDEGMLGIVVPMVRRTSPSTGSSYAETT